MRVPAMGVSLALLCIGGMQSAEAQSPFLVHQSPHFEIRYQPIVTEQEVRTVADYLEQDYAYLNQKLGLQLGQPLEVRIYGSVGNFLSGSHQRKPWRTGLYERGVLHLQPVQALTTRGLFEETLSFELAMAILDQAARKGCARWLREAFAVYHCGKMAKLTPPYGVALKHFSDLEQDIQDFPEPPQRDDVHFLLGQTMRFFSDNYGEDTALSVFKSFDGTSSIEDIFKKKFKQEYTAIEKSWADFIVGQTQKVPHR